MRTLVVMPTYNERESLGHTLRALFEHNPQVEVLVVDDNSPDGTAILVEEMQKVDARIHLLMRTKKEGLGPAYVAGFKWALDRNYELIAEMDADGSHRGEDFAKLLAKSNDADLVIGSRWVTGGKVVNWPKYREAISRIGNAYTRLMLGTKIRDMTAGFRIYRAELLKKLDLEKVSSQGYSFQVEMAYAATRNGVVVEVPINFVEREFGISKMTLAIVLEALTRVTLWGLKRIFN